MKRDRTFVVHIRAKDESGNVKGQGGATVVFVPTEGGMNKVGCSICHPGDNYNKSLGIRIATGRAQTNNVATEQLGSVEDYINMAHKIIINVVLEKCFIDTEERVKELDLFDEMADMYNDNIIWQAFGRALR
jgi:hypothetical protein